MNGISCEALRALEKTWEDRAQSLAEQIGEQRDSDFGNMAAGFLRLQMDEVDRCRGELAALLTTRQEVAPVADGAALLVRDVCEMAPADPDAPDTVCIRVADLTRIAELYTTTGQTSDARAALAYADPKELSEYLGGTGGPFLRIGPQNAIRCVPFYSGEPE